MSKSEFYNKSKNIVVILLFISMLLEIWPTILVLF